VDAYQGDQTSFCKIGQKILQPFFCQNEFVTFTLEKSSTQLLATSVDKINSYPIGGNSPNLVTLMHTKVQEAKL
jgi:hypothetical protein